jgi:hypothetical protein
LQNFPNNKGPLLLFNCCLSLLLRNGFEIYGNLKCRI